MAKLRVPSLNRSKGLLVKWREAGSLGDGFIWATLKKRCSLLFHWMHKGVARWRLRCLEGKLRANECLLYQTEPYLSNSKCNGRFNSSAKSAQLSASLLPPVPGTPSHCITQPTRCSRVDGITPFAPLFQELNNNLKVSQLLAIQLFPFNSTRILSSAQNNKGLLSRGTPTWYLPSVHLWCSAAQELL